MDSAEITNCEDAIRVLAQHLDAELDHRLDAQLLDHLDECRSCYSRAEFERQLKDRIRELGTEVLPDDVAHRLEALVQSFTATP